MVSSSYYLHIPGLLKPDELTVVENHFKNAVFTDGRSTASGAALEVKNNEQMSGDTETLTKFQSIVIGAISRNEIIQAAVMPKIITPPIFSRYKTGMNYGWHVDSPVMAQQQPIRSDVSMTLFLSDPASYKGGELVIQTETGNVAFKLNKGDAIIYPTTRLHIVNPVENGIRHAAVVWMQCAVRDASKREMLFDLKRILHEMYQKDKLSTEYLMLQQVYSNLMRMWIEI